MKMLLVMVSAVGLSAGCALRDGESSSTQAAVTCACRLPSGPCGCAHCAGDAAQPCICKVPPKVECTCAKAKGPGNCLCAHCSTGTGTCNCP